MSIIEEDNGQVKSMKKPGKRITDAKFKARPELRPDEWSCYNYADKFDLSPSSVNDMVARINVNDYSVTEFVEKFEKIYSPVVITGVTDTWKAKFKWTLPVSIN